MYGYFEKAVKLLEIREKWKNAFFIKNKCVHINNVNKKSSYKKCLAIKKF